MLLKVSTTLPLSGVHTRICKNYLSCLWAKKLLLVLSKILWRHKENHLLTHLVKNASKGESQVKRISWNRFNLNGWRLQLLLEKVRNFKTQEVCGSAILFDPTTSCFYLKHISLFLRQMQNYFFVLPKLRTSLTYDINTFGKKCLQRRK